MIEIIETIAKHPGKLRAAKGVTLSEPVWLHAGQALAVIQESNVKPTEPNPKLLYNMALRYAHDFGFLPKHEQENILRMMRQLWEEVRDFG